MQYNFKSDSDRWFVATALRTAAERYDEDAKTFAEPGPNSHPHLVRQFEDQAATARRIATEIEELEA